MGTVKAVCISRVKHTKKEEVDSAEIRVAHGLEGDAHAGSEREVSLLAIESIDRMRQKLPELDPGDFAENLTTQDMDLVALPIGARIKVGSDIVLEITQIGKKCHSKCNIYKQVGDCIMPREGVFAKVVTGGTVHRGDSIEVI